MNFTLNILGTASALPISDRFPSAQVLDVRGRLFLIDCGEGAQVRMRQAGVSYLKIEAIFLSHLHGDHMFGIYGLLSTMAMLGRTGKLDIYAPRAFRPMLEFFISRFGEGFNYEIEHHALDMTEPQTVLEIKNLTVKAFPLNHKMDCFGFLFRETEPQLNIRKEKIAEYGLGIAEMATAKRGEDIVRDDGSVIKCDEVAFKPYEPRSYAYCSDTAPFPELSGWIKGVDLLYHEATYTKEMTEKAAQRFHSTAEQAAICARDAEVGKLLIGHYSSKYPDLSVFLDEARTVFAESYLTHDLDVVDVPLKKL
ncbi:MAG: ribonuclease Z [Bacteroidales bacterium]|nr:ribonuclease Z [Candidatus Cryptobacteroides caccocaballi]